MAMVGHVQAQFLYTAHNARSGAMGGCLLLDGAHVRVDYRQAFLAEGMASKTVDLLLPVGERHSVAALFSHYGGAAYHEHQFAAAYFMRVSEVWTIAVAARYLHLGTADAYYPSEQWVAADAVVKAAVTPKVSFMLLAGSRQWDSRRPWRAHLQMAYSPSADWTTVVEAESEECLRLRYGMEYRLLEKVALRAGFSTAPVVLSFGTGLRHRQLSIDVAVEAHRWLGLTPQISLALCF